MAIQEPTNDMVIFIDGQPVRLSPEQSAARRKLLREAVAATVRLYRPALDRLEDA